jgi:hypothetical protein
MLYFIGKSSSLTYSQGFPYLNGSQYRVKNYTKKNVVKQFRSSASMECPSYHHTTDSMSRSQDTNTHVKEFNEASKMLPLKQNVKC